jgi:hypothetical protein
MESQHQEQNEPMRPRGRAERLSRHSAQQPRADRPPDAVIEYAFDAYPGITTIPGPVRQTPEVRRPARRRHQTPGKPGDGSRRRPSA